MDMVYSAMRHSLLLVSVGILLAYSFGQSAHANETWDFKSNYDQFTLSKQGSKYFLDGKEVKGRWAEELRPVLKLTLPFTCPDLPRRPDLSLTWKNQSQEIKRFFYIEKKMASDGKDCVDLTGLGIYYFPYHRFWFVGSEDLTIDLSEGFTFGDDSSTWVEFTKRDGRLQPKDLDYFADWTHLSEFRKLLRGFKLDGRAHPLILKDIDRVTNKKGFQLKAKGKTYKFHPIKKQMWLLELPNIPWLVLSPNLGVLETVTPEYWKSPFNGRLHGLRDKEKSQADRVNIVKSLKGESSPDVRRVFHDILLERGENVEVKSSIVDALRYSPSDENMAALADALEKTDQRELVDQIIKVLRLRNPKGPMIDQNDDWDDIQKVIAQWKAWATKFARAD